ncbi:MAG: acetolactate synthase large subunit, partial [Bdellovibrionales bacterium]|nr:acetolactate synthase large subunit [Bdellovibrionales bacterium]
RAVIESDTNGSNGKIKMGEVIHVLSSVTNGDAILTGDVGQNQMKAARYYQFSHTNSWITSGGLATMGFALPAAIGAKLATPEREVIAIVGDGGFQMTIQELATIRQENLAIKIVVLNNSYLGMVRQWQQLFFDRNYSHVQLQNPDFIKVADGFGIKGRRVSQRAELGDALKEMHQSEEAFLLEVEVEQEENVFPMVPAGAGISEIRLA